MHSDEQMANVSMDGWRVLLSLYHNIDAKAEGIAPGKNDPEAIQALKSLIESATLCEEALFEK